jgi:pilus assembly protein CpaC
VPNMKTQFRVLLFLFSGFIVSSVVCGPVFATGIKNLTWPDQSDAWGEPQTIVAGKSQVFRFDRPIERAAISDPEICDVNPIEDNEVLLNAKKAGAINLIVWDDSHNVAYFDIESIANVYKLVEILDRVDQNSDIDVIPFNDSLAVYGTTGTFRKAEQMGQAISAFNEHALNFIQVKEPKQILLEVRFIEVDRTNNKDRRLDAELLTRYLTARSLTGETGASSALLSPDITTRFPNRSVQAITASDDFDIFNSTTVTQSIGNLALSFAEDSTYVTPVLRWLETKNMLKIIARPNLVAKDGEEASFLVGGEFAYPISNQDDISVTFKKFGTQLYFSPEIIDDDLIHLTVETEVSELDFTNAVTISSTQVPGLISRTQKTVTELRNNQTLVIGGILTQRIFRSQKSVPVLGKIPVLNLLFKGEAFTRNDVELLVVITPRIVTPFTLDEEKQYFQPEQVQRAVRIVAPYAPDEHSSAIRDVLIQAEEQSKFDEKHPSTFIEEKRSKAMDVAMADFSTKAGSLPAHAAQTTNR